MSVGQVQRVFIQPCVARREEWIHPTQCCCCICGVSLRIWISFERSSGSSGSLLREAAEISFMFWPRQSKARGAGAVLVKVDVEDESQSALSQVHA